MARKDGEMGPMVVDVTCRAPFDLELSLRAMRSFGGAETESGAVRAGSRGAPAQAGSDAVAAEAGSRPQLPEAGGEEPVLRLGVRLDERPAVLEIRQVRVSPPVVRGESRPASGSTVSLSAMTARVVNAELDLGPFYELVSHHPVLGPLTRRLYGLKSFRPADLFDMLVTAVIEQQISLAAGRRIRARLVGRFGDEVEGEAVFPASAVLAAASIEELTECGLSRRKAEYVTGLAREVAGGRFDLEALEDASSDEVRARIVGLRGFGPWSADYVLIRGLGRPDAVPVDDLGVRSVVGRWLGDGGRPAATETAALLEPFTPYRGLAAFYLLVAARLT